jgi:hypothetical protein
MKEVQGFRFNNSPIKWVFDETINQAITMERVLEKFYELFPTDEPEDEYTFKPIGWVRDPEEEGKRIYGRETVVVAIYRKHYYCVVEKQFGNLYGPHPCRLFWRNYNELAWVAIVQISEMFYSDERMRAAIDTAIREKQFFQSDETKKSIVTIA